MPPLTYIYVSLNPLFLMTLEKTFMLTMSYLAEHPNITLLSITMNRGVFYAKLVLIYVHGLPTALPYNKLPPMTIPLIALQLSTYLKYGGTQLLILCP